MSDHLIQNVIDREAIRQLPVLYCHYVRNRMEDKLVGLFVENAKLGFLPAGGTFEGQAALRKMFKDSLDSIEPWPFIHNHVIELAGDKATGFCTAEVRSGKEKYRTVAIASYEDGYVKVAPGQWKFTSRILTYTPIPA